MSRILVVDDELALLRLLETHLRRLGHEVTCCATGNEGLEALDGPDADFDIAVLDHLLPDMHGMDLLNGVFQRRPGIGVLISSGSFMDKESLPLPEGKRIGFLQKPYLPKMLGEAIGQLLQSESGATA